MQNLTPRIQDRCEELGAWEVKLQVTKGRARMWKRRKCAASWLNVKTPSSLSPTTLLEEADEGSAVDSPYFHYFILLSLRVDGNKVLLALQPLQTTSCYDKVEASIIANRDDVWWDGLRKLQSSSCCSSFVELIYISLGRVSDITCVLGSLSSSLFV